MLKRIRINPIMANTEGNKKKKCVCSSRMMKLESVVKDLDARLNVVEECLLGMDSMRGRMFQLEKSMENALDRIMPRLDALLAGLPASATSQIASKPPIFPSFTPFPSVPSPTQASPVSGTAPTATRSKAGGATSSAQCTACHGKGACTCGKVSGTNTTVKTGAAASASVTADRTVFKGASVKSSSSDNKVAVALTPAAGDEDLEKQLRDAAARGDIVTCQKIMLQGVDSKKRDPVSGDTALHCAARAGHTECITQLLSVVKHPILTTNKQHQTPLMVAAAAGHAASVRLLLHLCKPCLSYKQGGGKALCQAAAEGKTEVVQALLDGGVRPTKEENGSGPSALHLAATNGHSKCLYELIKKGVSVALPDSDGQTALHKAALNGHSSCVTMLLAAGASPFDKDTSGWEPLHLAARGGHIECVKILLANGVDADPSGTAGQALAKNTNQKWPNAEEVMLIADIKAEPVETGNESS